MEKGNTMGISRTKSDQLVESMVAALKSPQSSDHSANGAVEGSGGLSRKSSRRITAASPGHSERKNTHIRKTRSAQLKIDFDELGSGAALSRASSASLGLSFSFTGFTMPPDQIGDTKPFSDDDMIRKSFSPLIYFNFIHYLTRLWYKIN
ncbi:ABC transporter G family member 22-like protein [Trifolium pratense]|uniref:ABC transporter G family member 22-like protein n=1 Tax=Trifolium pratense TaxID=57577 RepID=A0A2K3ND22_TRIPR|nr:ABC transporter G family member 22-like protein [Trifolium pratense]